MLQARIWLTIALALAIPALAFAEYVRPVAMFSLEKRGEWILPESDSHGLCKFFLRETEQGFRVDEPPFTEKEPLYTISRDGRIHCENRHPLLKSLEFMPLQWNMSGTKLAPSDRPDPVNPGAYDAFIKRALGIPGVYMAEVNHKPVRRPENAVAWVLRLHDDTLYAPRQSDPPRGSVCWFLRTPEGFEVRDFTDDPKGELLATITRDRVVHMSAVVHRRDGETSTIYWPYSMKRMRMAPLFEFEYWDWAQDNPELRLTKDGNAYGDVERVLVCPAP